jgi:hypothetical protein
MTLQNIRRYYEQPIRDICTGLNLPVLSSNQLNAEGEATSEYVQLTLTFGEMIEPAMGGNIENIRGSFVVGYFCPKGIGPGGSQDLMTQFMTALNNLSISPVARTYGVQGTVKSMSGPTFTALTDTPYFYSAVSCGVVANYQAP